MRNTDLGLFIHFHLGNDRLSANPFSPLISQTKKISPFSTTINTTNRSIEPHSYKSHPIHRGHQIRPQFFRSDQFDLLICPAPLLLGPACPDHLHYTSPCNPFILQIDSAAPKIHWVGHHMIYKHQGPMKREVNIRVSGHLLQFRYAGGRDPGSPDASSPLWVHPACGRVVGAEHCLFRMFSEASYADALRSAGRKTVRGK